jgi:ATP-dependent helicase/nuclease subunit A
LSKTFTIYRSSAGSGKTRTLAKEYLTLALRYRSEYFKHILAVTFTNKATQEMKDRILAYLNDFANGTRNELAAELKQELALDESAFREHAREVLSAILHGYSQFSISTIDAFFQKVIRSFTREAGLAGDYRLEVEQDAVLEEVIDNLIDELGSNDQLTRWVVEFAKENLENDRAWDVRESLIEFANEIFKEDYKNIEDEVIRETQRKDFFKDLLKDLRHLKFEFTGFVKAKAQEAVREIQLSGFREEDFKYANGGVYNFFRKVASITRVKDFDEDAKGKRPDTDYQDSINWPAKDSIHRAAIIALANGKLIALMNEILDYRSKNYGAALSAEVALNNFYAFGLIADISRKLKEFKDENNLMLLADAPKFLNGVIRDSDTPFIYEKVGSFYKNYLIDEFQDTSGLQWKNFFPLLVNSLDQGYKSLVVGDVKQAIYRWRGGDLQLLQDQVEQHIGSERVDIKGLNSNYRSSSSIVSFNNELFSTAALLVTEKTSQPISAAVYEDVSQHVFRQQEGFVQVQFLLESKEEKWQETALESVPAYLEKLQGLGVPLKDIAILVRRKEEGQQIVRYLLEYKNSEKANPLYRYDVVSNESLRVDGAASVRLILGAMRYLFNPDDDIARGQLAYEYYHLHALDRTLTEVFAVTNQVVFDTMLPPAFAKQKAALKKLPLFELTESIIQLFDLRGQQGEFAYLQAFQDAVLNFYSRERNDLSAFLEWWEENKHKTAIQVSGDVDAVQIFTIHKSKGLQFRYVIIPFCSWNLDHEVGKFPNLWVKSDKPPFQRAGYLPVRYSSALEETVFSEYYREEHTRSHLDNLNLLYVALTRAEHGLMVIAPFSKTSSVKSSAQLLYLGIQQNKNLVAGWDDAAKIFNAGSWVPQEVSERKENAEPVQLSVYPSYPWSDKLVIRQSAKEFFEGDDHPQREKIKYGIYLHAILSRIRYTEEIPDTLDGLLQEGMITAVEQDSLRTQLDELLQNREVAGWFSKEWEVHTEVPILLPDGAENRVDRLLLNGRKAVIVDFKTGEPDKHDQKQVLEYIDVLRKMNFIEVEGYLLYVRTGELAAVGQRKLKVVKKKDDNQLGLGI